MRRITNQAGDTGAALTGVMLVTLLMAAITAGFTALVITDSRVRFLDGTRTQAFYAAHAGLEKMTADLGNLFSNNFAPTGAQVNALTNTPPNLGNQWLAPDGTSGYTITFPQNAQGNPVSSVTTVQSGAFQGLVGLATPYTMTVTARLPDSSEASLTRTLQTVAIPVFQFGIYSENDLSFFAGPNFNFGGRVHSNSNVFLAEGPGATLTLADRVTAVGEIVRTNLSNGNLSATNHNGTVTAITAPGSFRTLAMNEGSLLGTLGSAQNPAWTNLSTGTYNHNIMNGRTGAKQLVLPITSFGGTPIGLIQRPVVNENVTNPNVLAERFYSLASLRILLSDATGDIMNLPGVTATNPLPLAGAPAGYTGSPFAATPALNAPLPGNANSRGYGMRMNAPGTPLLGGYIKIEMQNAAGNWTDVTLELLNLGVASQQVSVNNAAQNGCGDLTPNAVIRIQRPRSTFASTGVGNGCQTALPVDPRDWSPNVLFDPREGELRDNRSNTGNAANTEPARFGGYMYYVELDAANLSRWFLGQMPAAACPPTGCTGTQALSTNGYTVYFSDRRGNRNAVNAETGEYGNEDLVNPGNANGAPDNTLNTGEDFNGSGTLETYGRTALAPYNVPVAGVWPGGRQAWAGSVTAPYAQAMTPNTSTGALAATSERAALAERNPPMFFRRALKVTRGQSPGLVAPGLTIASENPLYLQGTWNSNGAVFDNTNCAANPCAAASHVATAFIVDSMTLLSNAWNDYNSLAGPFDLAQRAGTTTWYRFAVISGKGINFPYIGTQPDWDYGTDGGAHNFLRYIENWGGQTLNYRGSIASMYYSRQGTGTYKCCVDVYSPPTRGYNFDSDFLTPALLPPRTPMFRDVNILGFAQIIKP
jgi:Tfp pilus assembly protein PilX